MANVKANLLLLFVWSTFVLCQVRVLSAAENEATKEPLAFTVQVNGVGRPMILIPGLGCGSNVWEGTVAHFKNTYQCHLVTLAGFAGQPAIGEPFLERVRDGLVTYIHDQKLERPIIIGHSLGGFLTFWIGASIPDQVGPLISVDGVPYYPALRDSNASARSLLLVAQTQWMGLVMQTPEQFARSNQKVLAEMITDPKDVQKVAEVSNKSDPKAVAQAAFEIMTTDLRAEVQAIRTPILIIGATASIGNRDQRKIVEENYRLQVSSAARHKVVFAPKGRHFIQLDEPEFFIREVESFIKEADIAKD